MLEVVFKYPESMLLLPSTNAYQDKKTVIAINELAFSAPDHMCSNVVVTSKICKDLTYCEPLADTDDWPLVALSIELIRIHWAHFSVPKLR